MRREQSRSLRAIVEFSIQLRHNRDFRSAVQKLRARWGIDELGEDWPGARALEAGFPKPPSLANLRRAKRTYRMLEFQEDIGRLVKAFVPLDRFPAPVVDQADQSDPRVLALWHPLSRLIALCVVYDIDALPADVGVAVPAFGTFLPPSQFKHLGKRVPYAGSIVLALPPDCSKAEAYALVDEVLQRRDERFSQELARRGFKDVRATYETWRLRKQGYRFREIAGMLVERGLDESPRGETTLVERCKTASRDWDLPEVEWIPDD